MPNPKYLNPSITCTASDSRCATGIFAPRGIRFCLIFRSMGDLVPLCTRFTHAFMNMHQYVWVCHRSHPTCSRRCLHSCTLCDRTTDFKKESQGTVCNVYTTSNLQSLHGLVPICCAFPPSNWCVKLWMFQVRVLLCPATVSSSTAVDFGEVVHQVS